MSTLSEQEMKLFVRQACDDVRDKLERRRGKGGGYVTKEGLVRLINQRIAQAIKRKGNPQQVALIAALPMAVPFYWNLIHKGLLTMVSAELQRKSGLLPLWESYYKDRQFCWIPRAVITYDLAAQMAIERRESAETVLDMADVWALVASRLRGTQKVFADVEAQLMPEIQKILVK